MSGFRLLVDFEALEFIWGLPSSVARRIRRKLEEILNDPSRHCEYIEIDRDGRQCGGYIWDKYAFTYWVDHADRHIKVLKVRLADSRTFSERK